MGVATIVTLGSALTPIATDEENAPAVAVTVVSRSVVSVVLASPALSVIAVALASVPALAVNDTGTPTNRLPDASVTAAIMVTVPPVGDTAAGWRCPTQC